MHVGGMNMGSAPHACTATAGFVASMNPACHTHAMSTLQVRNLPDELHARLGERAQRLGMSMSEYVTRVLRDDLARPLVEDWAASARSGGAGRPIDVVGALDDVRVEYDPNT